MHEATPFQNRPLAAAAMILLYAGIIGFTDNFVRVIAAEAGLWQFHATRTLIALPLLALAAMVFGLRLRPVSLGAVAARSFLQGSAVMIYFGCLAFLPVVQVAAGLFTAPIFVLLISRFAFGHRIGPYRIVAVALGFAGMVLVLGPAEGATLGLASVLPVAAAVLYALGNIATREWCARESAAVLTAGFFVALGLIAFAGIAVLAIWPQAAPKGEAGFVLHGLVAPSATFWFWTFVQATGSLVAIGAMVRGYQLAEASRVAIFEYSVLPATALWTWLIWGDVPGTRAILGMALIFVAGSVIALRAR
jgi:drug/metabolite transporter (DMT)-like permease